MGFKARFCQGAKGDKNVHKYISRRVNGACMFDDLNPFNYTEEKISAYSHFHQVLKKGNFL